MFVGHYAPALISKGIEPRLPLWVLVLAVQFVDLLWGLFVLMGIEEVRLDPNLASNPLDLIYMPYTHSVLATVVWSLATFVLARAWLGGENRRAAFIAGAVASHWWLDLLVHRPDLPIINGDPKLGFALWDSPVLAFGVEIGFVLAATVYWMGTPNGRGLGWRPIVFSTVLVLMQGWVALGPLPTSETQLVVSALTSFVLVALLAAAIDTKPRPLDPIGVAAS